MELNERAWDTVRGRSEGKGRRGEGVTVLETNYELITWSQMLAAAESE